MNIEPELTEFGQLEVYEVIYKCYDADGKYLMGGSPELFLAMSFDECIETIKSWSEQDFRPPNPQGEENKMFVREIEITSAKKLGSLSLIGQETLSKFPKFLDKEDDHAN